MSNEKEQAIQRIAEQVKALPDEMQRAICWLVRNIDIADQLAEGEKLTEAEIERLTQTALANKDYIMLALLLYQQGKGS